MKTDYKFWYISRKDNVNIDEAAVRFYEGEVITGTKYKRSKRLDVADLGHLTSKIVKKESNEKDSIIYTQKDFGIISTDDELRVFLNSELRKDPRRIPIDEQNTLDIKKVK